MTRKAILATLAYHDVFNYPLTEDEVYSYLTESNFKRESLKRSLNVLIKEKKIGESKGYLFLNNRRAIVTLRLKRTGYSKTKLKRAQIYAKILKLVPTVQMIGVSGALAMENSHEKDDIDLVIITKRDKLWITRLLANALLFPFKRKPGSRKTNNRACLNLFFDESDLKIKDENIYQAHEICQLMPIWQRNNAYYNFIKANTWVKKYLPNWAPNVEELVLSACPELFRREVEGLRSKVEVKKNHKALVVSRLAFVVEILAKKLQLNYMKNKITVEKIGDTQLFFHPKNTQNWVLEEYQKRLINISAL